jgi:hypothetical protein
MELAIAGGGAHGEVNNWPGQMMAKAAGAFRERTEGGQKAASRKRKDNTHRKLELGIGFFASYDFSGQHTKKPPFLYI